MKYLLSLILFTSSLSSSYSQGIVTPIDATILSELPPSASEGDYFIRTDTPVGLIYLGLQNGVYHPIFSKGLPEILAINNSANGHPITNLINPIAPQDIATKWYVQNKGTENIYIKNGTLTSPRTLTGANKLLTYGNINIFSNQTVNYKLLANTTVNFEAGVIFKNILNSSTVITGNLSVTKKYIDSYDKSGDPGQLLSSTSSGTKWITVISPPPKTIKFAHAESPTGAGNLTQDWLSPTDEVANLSINIAEESILTIYYNFTFFIKKNNIQGDRITYITIKNSDGSIAFDRIAFSRNTTLASAENGKVAYRGTNYGTKKIVLTVGDYTIQLNTYGDMMVTTGSNNFILNKSQELYNYTGWNFSIIATPKNI